LQNKNVVGRLERGMAHTPGPFDLPLCLIQPDIQSDRLLQLNGRHIASFFSGKFPSNVTRNLFMSGFLH